MKAFGVLYLFEWKKILRQGLVPAAILLGVLLLLAANISPLLGTGYYYRYDAQRGTVDRALCPTGKWRSCGGTPSAPSPGRCWMRP